MNIRTTAIISQGKLKLYLSKTLFCDDSSYTASSMRGASELLKKMGLFATAAEMELNIKKAFYVTQDLDERELSTLSI